ncbi:MAG: metal-dependent hydrolase [Methanobacterium paludis]|nr:metal-dependent hydrolase [Methanobacterium paludis]
MMIKWLGHSAFQIVTDENLKILIDPFISNNPACDVAVEELSADVICVTHGHTDHFGDTMEIANRTGALIVCNHEISVYLSKQGFETLGMNMGGTVQVQDIIITMVNSTHSSDMDFIEEVSAGGSAGGFIIELENGRKIYHAGDTGVFGDMRTVIRDIYRPDIAMLPIGDRYTMGPFEAAIAAEWLDPEIIIPMHYNTYPAIEQNPLEFSDMVRRSNPNVKVVILQPDQIYQE